jgi:hypothetical protein
MCEDFVHQGMTVLQVEQEALRHVNSCLEMQQKTLADFPDMPQLHSSRDYSTTLLELAWNYDADALAQQAAHGVQMLNTEQKKVFTTITAAIANDAPCCRAFFLDAAGGCGKTLVLNSLLASVRMRHHIAVATAMTMTGTAASLLEGGSTAHSAFGFPLTFDDKETFISMLSMHSQRADILRPSQLILIDETTMGHKMLYHVLDQLLRDVMRSERPELGNLPFGDKVAVFSGDWRQLPPVIPHAGRTATVQSSLKFSELWRTIESLQLTHNMRLFAVVWKQSC